MKSPVSYYPEPRVLIYLAETGLWDDKIFGWGKVEKRDIAIGETPTHYVTRIHISDMDYWDKDDVRFSVVCVSYLGVHKSRFKEWVDLSIPKLDLSKFQQLTLF